MTAAIVPASRLDLPAAPGLLAALRAKGDGDVQLDMSEVTYLGALCLQVILAAATSLKAAERTLSLINTSDRVVDQLRVMGLTPEAISKGRQ